MLDRRSALALLGAGAAGLSGGRAAAQTATPVRLGASLDDGVTPALYALESGIFKRMGLDVALTRSTSGAALAVAVAGGSIDIAKSALMSIITAYAHGIHFKVVAGAAVYNAKAPTDLLCVLKSSPIRTPADLKGVVAVSSLQSLEQMSIQSAIDQHGGNSANVHFIELPFVGMFGALQQGRADAASIGNPILQSVIDSNAVRSLGDPYAALGDGFLEAGWFCTEQYARDQADSVQRFSAAMREAATYTNAHHDATVTLLADFAKMSPDVIRRMNRLTNATTLTPAAIQTSIDAAYKYGYISTSFSAAELLLS
jgi:NitT/TauT family transport system substrate-binding protein